MSTTGERPRVRLVEAAGLTLGDVRAILDAEVLTGAAGATVVRSIGSADLLSDVLALGTAGMLLLTGLVTVQTIRTAEVADLVGVVFVRGKPVEEDVLAPARDAGLTVMRTGLTLFEASGRIFAELQRRGAEPARPA